MKSAIRRLANQASGPPVPLTANYRRGQMFDLGSGRGSRETFMRQYGQSGTVFAIVSLLQQAAAGPKWHLYKKQKKDGRVRYTTGDQGSDQRTEVLQHPALSLWNKPNDFMTGFEFREGSNQHFELAGETFWVANREVVTFPTSLWYVNPSRMEPVPDPDNFIVGWVYTGPNGQQVPMQLGEVIQEKMPDPLDMFRGAGPVASITPNIQQQRYATEYQRNLFVNGADPGGTITVPNKLTDREFDELVDRWREQHQGIARAGAIAVMENGAVWNTAGMSNKDLEYGELRLANRDEIREAWRMHKAMLGTSDDVNRANAQTASELFSSDHVTPRLERRRDTLNYKLLPMFGDDSVEFDFEDPSPENAEAAIAEMSAKATNAAALIGAGLDPADVLEALGLPDMGVVEKATQEPALPPGWVPAAPAAPAAPAGGAPAQETVNLTRPRPLALQPRASGPQSPRWPGWQLDMQAVAYWSPLLAAAAAGALTKARAQQLAAAYLTANPDGTPQDQGKREATASAAAWLTAQGLTFVPAVTGLMPGIITDSYLIGSASAAALADSTTADTGGWEPGDTHAAQQAIAALGLSAGLATALAAAPQNAQQVSDGYVNSVARPLADGAAEGLGAAAIAATMTAAVATVAIASTAVLNHVSAVVGGAAMALYAKRGVRNGAWLLEDGNACPLCQANADAGPLPLGTAYPSGAVTVPGHLNCRCALVPQSGDSTADLSAVLLRILNDGYVPVETGRR